MNRADQPDRLQEASPLIRVNSCAYQVAMYCDEEMLGPMLERCGVCEGTDVRNRVRLQVDPVLMLRACGTCDALGASRLPSPATLDDYYRTYYQGRSILTTMPQPERIVRRIAEVIGHRSESRILDLGGGDGSVAATLAEHLDVEPDITVIDKSVGRSARRGVRHLGELSDIPSGERFGVVIASAVLEHIPRPGPVLNELIDRLEVGGILYARTPFMGPLMRVLHRFGVIIDSTYPGHLYDLGPRFWNGLPRWLPAARGLEVRSSRPSPIETTWRTSPARTVAASVLKAPRSFLGPAWPFVGGWEFIARRRPD